MKKRMLSAFLSLCMVLTMVPAAFAGDGEDVSSSPQPLSDSPVTTWTDLKNAIENEEGEEPITVALGEDIRADANGTITVSQDVTLDLGTYTLTANGASTFITVNSGTLTIRGSGCIDGGDKKVVQVNENGTFKMEGGTLKTTGDFATALSFSKSTGENSIIGGTIESVYTAVLVGNSNLTIGTESADNSSITINTNTAGKVAAYAVAVSSNSNLTINSGTFISANASYSLLNAQDYTSGKTPPTIEIKGGDYQNANESSLVAIIPNEAKQYFTVTGGTFNKQIPKECIGAGFALVQDGDGYKVDTLTNAPVQLTYDTEQPANYASVEAALAAAEKAVAEEKTYVKVAISSEVAEVTTTSALTVPAGVTLEIASDKTLSCGAMTVEKGATLTNNGTIISTNGVTNKGTLTNKGSMTAGYIIADTGEWKNETSCTVTLTGDSVMDSSITAANFTVTDGALKVADDAQDVTLKVNGTTAVAGVNPGKHTWTNNNWADVKATIRVTDASGTILETDSLAEALAAVNSGEGGATVTLLESISNTETLPEVTMDFTLDLATNTLSTTQPIKVGSDDSHDTIATVKNGEILFTSPTGTALDVKGDVTTSNLNIGVSDLSSAYGVTVEGGDFTLSADSSISTHLVGIMVLGNEPTVDVYGTVTTTHLAGNPVNDIAIQGNGSETTDSTITLYDTAEVSATGMGIYHPQIGTLTVDGASVTGGTAIGMKGGTLNVLNDASITATGEKQAVTEPGTSGITSTGDAIYVEGNYADRPVQVNIENGTVTSENGNAVQVSNAQSNSGDTNSKDVSISGGTLNGNIVTDSTDTNNTITVSNGTVNGTIEAETAAENAVTVTGGSVSGDISGFVPEGTTYYTVTFDANGGNCDEFTRTYVVSDESSMKLGTLPTASRTGYRFNGWYYDGSQVSAETVVTENMTLEASWSRISSGGGGGGATSTSYAVSVSSGIDNGSVTVSPKNAAKGATVTITVTPDAGYELDTLTVKDASGNAIDLTRESDTTYTFEMPSGRVTVDATFAEISTTPSNPFADVASNAYYADAVLWAVENDITEGTSATTFSPNASCTRAQMVTFLWRAAGSPEPQSAENPFTDVSSNAYYADAVLWAVEQGITTGTSETTFSPNATVTRGQTVTFLYRDAGSPAASAAGTFTDVAADAYYAAAVQWAVSEGVTDGMTSTTFQPDGNCTRAQIVTFLYRYLVA